MLPDEEERQFYKKLEENAEEVTNQKVTFRYVELYPEELKQHPVNVTLYGEAKVNMGLVKSISENGLFEPFIITEDDIIINGNGRWLALIYINKNLKSGVKGATVTNPQIKLKAKCQVITFKGENEEKKAIEEKIAIIEYSKDRKKLYSQKYNEIEMLHEIYDDGARENSRFNLKRQNCSDSDVSKLARRLRSSPAEITDLVDWSLTDEEIVDHYGYLIQDQFEEGVTEFDKESIRTRDKIGKEIGMGGTNVDKLTEIGRLAKTGDEVGLMAMKNLDDGKWKINGAHIVVQMRKYFLSGATKGKGIVYGLIKEVMNGTKKPLDAKTEFNKLVPPSIHHKTTKTTIKSTYSIIFLDPLTNPKAYYLPSDVKNIDYLAVEEPTSFLGINEAEINYYMNEVDIPAAEDAALFLIANVLTLKDCFELIRLWNFEIQSFAIMQPKQKGYGNWFVSGYDLLLFRYS